MIMKKDYFQMKVILLLLLTCMVMLQTYIPLLCQHNEKIKLVNNRLREITETKSSVEWLVFRNTTSIDTTDIFKYFYEDLNINRKIHFVCKKFRVDKYGQTHSTYQQVFKGVPILGTNYIIHSYKGKVNLCNGTLLNISDCSITPKYNVNTLMTKNQDG